ncbi:hypothetical protein LINPERPRIM_LOCUS40086 [Linum perenne]
MAMLGLRWSPQFCQREPTSLKKKGTRGSRAKTTWVL